MGSRASTARLFGDLSVEGFLEHHWQKQPLLVRGTLGEALPALTPEELAGLACEEDVDSRLVLETGGSRPWEIRHGPFRAGDFTTLPAERWSLLVQQVETRVAEVAGLQEHFRFLPNWRLDDVMVSYATRNGGVGAHVDNYDVFLIQGRGRRRWRIRREPVEDAACLPDLDVDILARFEPDLEWDLSPGDMLYLPPRIAHHGVALEDCMTYSIGCRAPSRRELVAGLLGHAVEAMDDTARYTDAGLRLSDDPGEIGRETVRRLREGIVEWVGDESLLLDWFGRFVTEPRREPAEVPLEPPLRAVDLQRAIRSGAGLQRSAVPRFSYARDSGGRTVLFVGGERHDLPARLAWAAPLICGRALLNADVLRSNLDDDDFVELLTEICNRGCLILDDDPG